MQTKTIYDTTRAAAVKQMPWATKVVKVCGGYMGFESISDYETWKRQK
jgi:hypothetical protein